jgi:hypothetical protein
MFISVIREGQGRFMIEKNQWAFRLVIILVVCFCSLARVYGASQEIRPASQMSGTIIAPQEERKQALSAGDKILVSLEKARPVKKGDMPEIFQPTSLPFEGKGDYPFMKVGQVIILEIITDRLLLGLIESSIREIAVGDRLYFPEP